MSKLNDPRFKDANLTRHNSMILNIADRNLGKKPVIHPNKVSSRLNKAKGGSVEKGNVKQVKSLSPADKTEESGKNKENRMFCSSLVKKLPVSNNSQEQDSSIEMDIGDFLKVIKKKVDRVDKKHGYSSTNSRIREFLDIFDEFSNYFHDFKFFLNKFKRLFEQVYLKNILLMNELEEFKENLRKPQEKLYKDEDDIDEVSLRKVSSDMHINKIPVFMKKNSHLTGPKSKLLPENSDLGIIHEKHKSTLDPKPILERTSSKGKIPKLSFTENTINVQGFQDEFMQNIDNFSSSWRKMINDQKRFD